MKRIYSWIPDLPDQRDFTYKVEAPRTLPEKIDLRNQYQKIYDQGSLGSCTANAIAIAYDFERLRQGTWPVNPSRLFIYFNERDIEGTVGFDSGAMIRDGIKTIANHGVCGEKRWPYNIVKFREKPPVRCYDVAAGYKAKEYLRLEADDNFTLVDVLKTCLADGFGFVFGFSVYQSFESDDVALTGMAPVPVRGERLLGGHAVFCCGYDDETRCLIVRNSWGEDWGDKGHFYLPYEYVERGLCDDFWTLRLV